MSIRPSIAVFGFLLAIAVVTGATGPKEELQQWLPGELDPKCRQMLDEKWAQASAKSLGKEGDESEIRKVELPERARVVEIRWLSADVVIAQSEFYQARYRTFIVREDGKWIFVRQYLLGWYCWRIEK